MGNGDEIEAALHLVAEVGFGHGLLGDELERSVRSLTVELGELKATLAELRVALATDKSQPLDLPALPRRELN
jgi:hypothetical protein